ncbi:aminotransferase class V-fold PLP-dependent enzyme [Spirulina sp. CS-785/01]|uniref:aminotransferase class V-fold PLP-dependent enzyme n=1 Tax=Spirulina sp. CS-785/01 TaxID=3021716 RepID=UPI00232FB72B|nr:aminotransferase class V-fold PLP-dependent enzyme [Spirulina sp. CS-785/01]MDB9313602.1 aminotransferase class V-fold PLP-dependent enzyme [Spirulina sp. CS-785/01]
MSSVSSTQTAIKEHRQHFPRLANKAYFNYGGQGPMPKPALEAIYRAYELIQQQGPFSAKANEWVQQETQAVRAALASELETNPANITLTENVTHGCNIVLWGIDWKPGDHILITDCEHPGIIATLKELCRRKGVRVTTCPLLATLNRGNPINVIQQHLQDETRLVVLSHLFWNTGQVLPLADIVELCRGCSGSRPIQILVDAAQSAGSLPLHLDELGADFYAFTGHKWFCGPAGVGGLYVHPNAQDSISPTFIGWRSVNIDSTGMPGDWKPDGRRFEVATSAYPQYAGLRAAIAIHQKWGTPQDRYTKLCYNSEYLWQGLSILPQISCLRQETPEAGIVSFQLKVDIPHKQLVQALEQQGFYLRTLASPDCIRACVHYFTLPGEMDQLIKVLGSL